MLQPQSSRRRFFGQALATAGVLGFGQAAFPWFVPKPTGKAKRCVLLWMNGGPSQLETFDPKPGTKTGGPTQSIKTAVTGMNIADALPKLASRMNQLCVLRNVSSEEGEHERAQYYLHTGFRMVPAFPRPALGSVVSQQTQPLEFPKYVLLGERSFGPAYCGPDHASFTIEDAAASRELLTQILRRADDLKFARALNSEFDARNSFPDIARRTSMLQQIETIARTRFRETLNLEAESAATRQRYGDNGFGRRCLLARRLLENDVPFVEVQLDGWDTHINNFDETRQLATSVDHAWSALIDDLVSNGLWQDTLLVWMGDFGRTPVINGQNGRDHFPGVTPIVLGGGCLNTGQVIGSTNREGTAIDGDTLSVADVSATILAALGTAPDTEMTTSFGSPTTVTDDGQVIDGVLAG